MVYYHCSPTAGLTLLEPRSPESFGKPRGVYLTTSLPMALMYGIRNFEYSYGYTKDGQIYFDEYWRSSIGEKAPAFTGARPRMSAPRRSPMRRYRIRRFPSWRKPPVPDVYEALLEQERQGALVIHRYAGQSHEMLAWI